MPDELELLNEAKKGNEEARAKLIADFTPFIYKLTSNFCGRTLAPQNDDELSISLAAFNEAIDSFDTAKGKEFKNYAALVIKSRLSDYFRKEKRHDHLPLTEENLEIGDLNDWAQDEKVEEALDRKAEVELLQDLIEKYNISFRKLENSSPKHKDTRAALLKTAIFLAKDASLRQDLEKNKKLPLEELSQKTGFSRKVLKNGRDYIIALFLILSRKEFSYLRSLLSLPYVESAKEEEDLGDEEE
jgi:RNA polymerase sigma factor